MILVRINNITAVQEIIEQEFIRQVSKLDIEEKEIIEQENVLNKILHSIEMLKNARQIRKVIREAIAYVIVKHKFKKE